MEPIPNKQIHVVGGGTIYPVREHLALSAPAYGTTARQLAGLCVEQWGDTADVELHLTKMANRDSRLETADDMRKLAVKLTGDYATKAVFWSPAICDFEGSIGDVKSQKHADRLSSANHQAMLLSPADKIISTFRQDKINGNKPRKDITLVAFKTTTGADEAEQYSAGLDLVKRASANLVLANDTRTKMNMVIAPEEASYHVTRNREEALRGLVEMAFLRSQLTFTESTVIGGEPTPWDSEEVFPALRAVVDYCISRGAYKPFRGVTAGHFAAKIGPNEFLTSMRKTNYNDLHNIGLVRIKTDGKDKVIAIGGKPSVGGQSQRIVFEQHPELDCIAHFHCPLRPGSSVPVMSQREYECGSHECGQNTSNGLAEIEDGIQAVYLDNHGPNIVFHHSIDPQKVIEFIERNFDLTAKTGGYTPRTN